MLVARKGGRAGDLSPTAATSPKEGAAKRFLTKKSASVVFDHIPAGDHSSDTSDQTKPQELLVEYFPDPPCVAPFEEEGDEMRKRTLSGTAPQAYLKSHVLWKPDDPALAECRSRMEDFRSFWSRQARGSQCSTSSSSPSIYAYVNISCNPIEILSKPQQITKDTSKDYRTGQSVMPGQCVAVERMYDKHANRLLKLAEGKGWIVDSPFHSNPVMCRLGEVDVSRKWYINIARAVVVVRCAPTVSRESRTAFALAPQELIVADVRARVRGRSYVHLADGRGWVFTMSPWSNRKQRLFSDTVLHECDHEVLQQDDVEAEMLPATNEVVEVGSWTYIVGREPVLAIGAEANGVYIDGGEVIRVDKRAYGWGEAPQGDLPEIRWLRLSDGRGWVPDQDQFGNAFVTLRTWANLMEWPHLRGTQSMDPPRHEWMVGVV